MDEQYLAADEAFAEHDMGDAEVVESDGWETDGPDRLIKRFYWTDEYCDPNEDSLTASFCVNFKKGTNEVEEAYVNW